MLEYEEKLVLLAGRSEEEIIDLGLYCGLKKFLTTKEYLACFPQMVPESLNSSVALSEWQLKKIKKRALSRNPFLQDLPPDRPFKMAAIFILSCPVLWQVDIQVGDCV